MTRKELKIEADKRGISIHGLNKDQILEKIRKWDERLEGYQRLSLPKSGV